MRIRVSVGGIDQECCGQAQELNDVVTWQLFLRSQTLPGDADYFESHHELVSHVSCVTGRVVQIDAVTDAGDLVEITRLPSGDELRGPYEESPIETWEGLTLPVGPSEFIVTLDIHESTELPTSSELRYR